MYNRSDARSTISGISKYSRIVSKLNEFEQHTAFVPT